jgi:acetyl esterase/lipase
LVAADHRAGTVADEVDVAYGPYDDQVLDVYRTTAPTRRGTIVFVHGGGWTSGNKETLTAGTFGPVLAQLDRGFDLVSVDYRLAPAHPFPAALDDVSLAIDWVRAQGAVHGVDTRRVVVLGHSAGGSLAAMVGTSPGLATEFGTIPRVDRWVAISAMSIYDGSGLLDDFPGGWGLSSPAARLMAAPINTIDRNDPPGYLVHGDMDGFVADWHSVFFAARAAAVGADVRLDHITTGSNECRGHFGPCGADLTPLQAFLG